MRAPEGVVQEMSSPSVVQWAGGHDYKTNVAFNCMATSGEHKLLGEPVAFDLQQKLAATCWHDHMPCGSVTIPAAVCRRSASISIHRSLFKTSLLSWKAPLHFQ